MNSALFLFLALLIPFIFHFLLDQKVKQKIKSHRSRSGEISLGHHAESFASLVTASAFRMLLTNRNFTNPRFRPDELRCLGDGILFLFLFNQFIRTAKSMKESTLRTCINLHNLLVDFLHNKIEICGK